MNKTVKTIMTVEEIQTPGGYYQVVVIGVVVHLFGTMMVCLFKKKKVSFLNRGTSLERDTYIGLFTKERL